MPQYTHIACKNVNYDAPIYKNLVHDLNRYHNTCKINTGTQHCMIIANRLGMHVMETVNVSACDIK